jgi:heme A synthase
MNTFTIVFLSISVLSLSYGLFLVIKQKKRYWIPSLIFLALSILMIILGQTVTVTGGSFADVMYTVLGVFLALLAVVVMLITLFIQSRKHKGDED